MNVDTTILSVRGLRKSFGLTEIIRGVDIDLGKGERRAQVFDAGNCVHVAFSIAERRFAHRPWAKS